MENPTNPNYKIVIKGNEDIQDNIKGNELSMLPIYDDKDEIYYSISTNEFTLTQEQFKRIETENEEEEKINEEIINKLLYNIKYLPEKNENIIEPIITSNKLNLKLYLGFSIN